MSFINPLNVLLAALVGAGVFALTVALLSQRPVNLSETEKLFGAGSVDLPWHVRLQRQLDLAGIDLTVATFLPMLLMLSLLAGLAAYLVSGAWLAGVLGLVLGALGYWLYLSQKADRALETYEEELPQVLARLVAGARLGNSLPVAAEHVAQFGPPLCRADWAYIAAQLRANAPAEQVFKVIGLRRGSQLLNSILELLLLQQARRTPLSEALPLIQASLEDRVRTIRRARTQMKGPIRELWIVCSAPFAAVLVLRLMSPEFTAIYSTPLGQVLLLIGWGMALVALALAHRSFSQALRRETDFSGGLKPAPRPTLPPKAPPGGHAGGGPSHRAPVSLAGLTGQAQAEAIREGSAPHA
ncbi:MAG: type II secretion system F family protein [Anaerolineales bacterium]|nr:type II secretion system F family protein [Anaerolineales bacterium]